VVTRDSLDVLCHAAIRARAQRVLLACTYTSDGWDSLLSLTGGAALGEDGPVVTVNIAADGSVTAAAGGELPGVTSHAGEGKPAPQLQAPTGTDKWVLTVRG
jgi:hypothetical protein